MTKRTKIIAGLVVVLILTPVLVVSAYNMMPDSPYKLEKFAHPFTIVDPADPRFNPHSFRFDIYRSEPSFQLALETLFPVGTSRDTVEDILFQQSDLRSGYAEGKNENYFITYYFDGDALHSTPELRLFGLGLREAQLEYDLNDRVITINSHILLSGQPPRFFKGIKIHKGEKT